MLLLYGDGHEYTVSSPLSLTAPAFAAIEVYGADRMHAVQITLEDDPPKITLDRITNPAVRN